MKFYAFHFAYIPYFNLECPLSPGLHSLPRVTLPIVCGDSEKSKNLPIKTSTNNNYHY